MKNTDYIGYRSLYNKLEKMSIQCGKSETSYNYFKSEVNRIEFELERKIRLSKILISIKGKTND